MLEFFFSLLLLLTLVWIVHRRSHLRFRVRLELFLGIALVLLAASYVIAKRFAGGLGAVSNMSDAFPWGIWITFDLCGVALAAGGFVLAGTIHVFHLRRLEPVLRPVVLTALISYLLVAAILVLDLGRPYRFWHPLVMWQPHSVMFEITFCLTLYTGVLFFEISPAVFERLRWEWAVRLVHRMALPAVILGVILSTLHQSSFGSLFLIIPGKLSPLWYSPLLPVFFLVSAVSAGIAVVMLESYWCARWIGRGLPAGLAASLGRACAWVLWVYLALRLGDFLWRGVYAGALEAPWLGVSWLAEIMIGVAAPALLLSRARWRASNTGLLAAPSLVVCGVILNRMNVSWLGLIPGTRYAYVPHWGEGLLTFAFVVIGVLAFLAIAQMLPIFPESATGDERRATSPRRVQ